VFWTDGAGNVMQVDAAGVTAPITLATGQGTGPNWIATNATATSVYWTNYINGGLYRATKGTPGAILVAPTNQPQIVALNSSYVYYESYLTNPTVRRINRIPIGGGTPQQVIDLLNLAYLGLYWTVDDTYIYLLLQQITSTDLYQANADGTNIVADYNSHITSFVIGDGEFLSLDTPNPNSKIGNLIYASVGPLVAVDSAYAYYGVSAGQDKAAWPLPSSGGIVRQSLCRGPVELLGGWGALTAVDDLWIYTAGSAEIARIPRF
jgi:hypothetical protein